MAGRVLAIVEGTASGLHRRALPAVALAQRLASESACEADAVLAGPAAVVPGRWARSWQCDAPAPEVLARGLSALSRANGYTAIIAGDTPFGRELAARLAVQLDVPVAAPVLSLRARGESLHAVCPARAGAATATLELRRSPAVVIAHPDVTGAPAPANTPALAAEPLAICNGPSALQLIGEEQVGPWDMDVTDADVVISGGRGVGPEGFAMLGDLAGLLGGSVGATRVAVDLGWVPYARQVGLTGKSVSPRLYVACGISGAIHHTLGMRDSSFIVAINTDANAPIFKVANVAIVGDVTQVLPALIADLRGRTPAARIPALAGAAL
jgi:electron transfer flavoprotein alpha subunit